MEKTITQKPRKALDAIEVLMQDHREVESLFREFESLTNDEEERAAQLVANVCAELTICAKLEIEIFYPAVHEAAEAEEIKNLLDDAEDRHDAVAVLIERLGKMADHRKRDAQFTALSEHVKRHVEEEEAKLYPKAKKLKGLDLVAVAAEMKARKIELISQTGVAEEDAETA